MDSRPGHSSKQKTAAPRKQKSRGKGLRARTGCTSCRARRIKCDETHPICRACQRSNRECAYAQSREGQRNSAAAVGQQAEGLSTLRPGQQHYEHQPQDETNASGGPNETRPEHAEPRGGDTLTPSSLSPSSGHLQSLHPSASASEPVQEAGSLPTYEAHLHGPNRDAVWPDWPSVSAETASLWWFGLVANDAAQGELCVPNNHTAQAQVDAAVVDDLEINHALHETDQLAPSLNVIHGNAYVSQDVIELTSDESKLLRHFVLRLSPLIDVTDPDQYFALSIPHMAMKNRGLMSALLALSARHLSLDRVGEHCDSDRHMYRTAALQHYYDTLRYLQDEMKIPSFLRSDELLATVLTISTYEMFDGSNGGWERHLKGVFWIQRSQAIHGESQGLKKRIWWAWLRQDIWVAYRERREILSFYKLTQPCSSLDFWELVDRAFYLLGQCVNFASKRREELARHNLQMRVDQSSELWGSLREWWTYFTKFDHRLPAAWASSPAFEPIWLNPPAASVAIQVHQWSKLLLSEHAPAAGGLKELLSRQKELRSAAEIICGIGSCTQDIGPTILSSQCLFAAGKYADDTAQQQQILEMLNQHHKRSGWPHYDLGAELQEIWKSSKT